MNIIFTIGHGLRGYFAQVMDGSTGEVIQTGDLSFEYPNDAWKEAADWAESENWIAQAEKIRYNLLYPIGERGQALGHCCGNGCFDCEFWSRPQKQTKGCKVV